MVELSRAIDVDWRELLKVRFVAAEPDHTPSNVDLSEELILDPERTLHERYGAGQECLYLIRPDGYVGYRSEPATASALNDYLASVFRP
jgi:hypothetical protein